MDPLDLTGLQQKFVVHTSSCSSQRLEPLSCSVTKEIPDHIPELLVSKLPTIVDSIFVVVYPSFESLSLPSEVPFAIAELNFVHIYEIRLEKDERVSLEEVRRRLLDNYGKEGLPGIGCLNVWKAEGEPECKLVLNLVFTDVVLVALTLSLFDVCGFCKLGEIASIISSIYGTEVRTSQHKTLAQNKVQAKKGD